MRLFHCLMPVVACACILGLFSGCVKGPDKELAEAKAAIKAAQDAEADKYMPNNFKNLQKALASAQGEIDIQNSNFILSRNYAKAKQLLRNTTDLANEIAADAPGAKADMKEQVEYGINKAQELVKETRVDIRKAPRSKGKKLLAQMAKDVDTADSTLVRAAADFSEGNIVGAKKNLTDAQKLLKKVFDQLSTSGTDGLM